MIQIFYSVCFLILGMGLPVLAKTTTVNHPSPSTSSKTGNKSVLAPAPVASVAKAKEQSAKKMAILTPDVSRGSLSPVQQAKQTAASPLPAKHPVTTPQLAKQTSAPASLAKHKAASSMASATPAHATHSLSTSSSMVIRNSALVTYGENAPLRTVSGPVTTSLDSDRGDSGARLARVTAYSAAEGDYYTERCISSTGVRLHDGHCAVDPNIIPYGSVVEIAGVGKFLAVDTGSAVISRTAAREGGHTSAERHAIVVDLFFEDRSEGERFAAGAAKYVSISWWTPTSMGIEAKAARGLFAEEDWTKIQGKQL